MKEARFASIYLLLWTLFSCYRPCNPFRSGRAIPISIQKRGKFVGVLRGAAKEVFVGVHRTETSESRYIIDGKTRKMLLSNKAPVKVGIRPSLSLEKDLHVLSLSRNEVRLTCENCNTAATNEIPLLYPSPHLMRVSSHLSAAVSAMSQIHKQSGLIVVMNGIGDSYGEMLNDYRTSANSLTDFHFLKEPESIEISQKRLKPGFSYREGESAYVFNIHKQLFRPIRKSWIEESSSSLYSKLEGSMEVAYSFAVSLISDSTLLLPNELSLFHLPAVTNINESYSFQALPPSLQLLLSKELSLSTSLDLRDNQELLLSGELFLELDGTINRQFLSALMLERKRRRFTIPEKVKILQGIQENFLKTIVGQLRQLREADEEGKNLILCSEFFRKHPQQFYQFTVMNEQLNLFEDIKLVHVDHQSIAKGRAALAYQAYCDENNKPEPSRSHGIPLLKSNDIESNQAFFLRSATQFWEEDKDNSTILSSLLKHYEPYFDIKLLKNTQEMFDHMIEDLNMGRLVGSFPNLNPSAVGKGSVFVHPSRFPSNIEKLKKFLTVFFHSTRSLSFPISILSDAVNKWFEVDEMKKLDAFELNEFQFQVKMNSSQLTKLPLLSRASLFQHFPVRAISPNDNSSSFLLGLLNKFQNKADLPLLIDFPLPKAIPSSSVRALTKPLDNYPNILNFFLAMRGSIHSFYLNGKYRITLKEFPLDLINTKFVVNEPSMKEEDLLICGKKLLKTQLTYFSSNDSAEEVRIQDSSMTIDLTQMTEEQEEGEEWRRLPSELHLEILQILQEIPDFSSMVVNDERLKYDLKEENKYRDHSNTHPMTIGSLWNYLKQMHSADNTPAFEENEDNDADDDLSAQERLKKIELQYTNEQNKKTSEWNDLKKALEWLYFEGLIQITRDEDAPDTDVNYSKFTIPKENPVKEEEEEEEEPPKLQKDGFYDLEGAVYDPELLELRKKFAGSQTIDLSDIEKYRRKPE